MVELREIKAFLTLAEELHFGRTAARLGLTQSRVSQSLRSLERKLGEQLSTDQPSGCDDDAGRALPSGG